MAQDFATGTPLIDGHGNFGSIDNDPPAAMRYTECRLTSVAHQALLQDLDTDTVDYTPNFDGNEVEPMVLPAKLPFLLLNGASGIAVGMATNVPPHNLGELMDACIALLEAHDGIRPTLTDTDLNTIVPAPDFPTGAYILGTTASHNLHNTGHGGIILRAKTHIEQISKSRTAIVVTELPYQVNKAALLERLATMVNEKKIDGIADLRDESDREGIRVVIDLKRDALPAVVLNNLFKKASLQTTFSGNFLALVGSKPERFTLRSALEEFLNFRFTTVRRRAAHHMNKESTRSHIVEGLLKALSGIDTVIDTIRSAPDLATAREALLRNNTNTSLALTKDQAESVLKLPLGSLTRLNKEKLEEEQKSLKTSMKYLQRLLKEDSVVRKAMIKEFLELKDKFAIPRRTTIEREETGELNDLDLIENTRSVIIVNKGAYIKRMPLSAFESQRRGTRGKRGTSSSGSTSSSTHSPDEDGNNHDNEVAHCFTCNDHDVLLVISNNGVAFSLRAYQVPQTTRTAKGVPLPSVLPMKGDDYVAAILPVSEFPSGEEECIVLVTEHGWIKKTPLDAFQNLTSRGLIIAALEDGDRLRWAKRCNNEDDILLGTTMGMATRFKASEVRPTGRTSRGITSMKLKDGDKIADMSILMTKLESSSEDHIHGEPKSSSQEEEYVLAVTSNGYGKRIRTGEFRSQARGGVGVIATKFKQLGETKDTVSCLRVVREEDEVLLVTERGIIMRQKVRDIPCQGRAATGVLLQKVNFKSGDAISSVSVVEPIIE
jgi:DNA gyrase subunit A